MVNVQVTETDNVYIVNGRKVKVFGGQMYSETELSNFERKCLREMVNARRRGMMISSSINTERSKA
jgi:hypothetical protein